MYLELDPNSELYADGLAWANICFGYYSVVAFLFALVMPTLANLMGNIRLHFMSNYRRNRFDKYWTDS